MGCNKIAYAHHRDDVIETMMMSLFYEGRFHSFSPLTYLDRMDLTVIRPMIFCHRGRCHRVSEQIPASCMQKPMPHGRIHKAAVY